LVSSGLKSGTKNQFSFTFVVTAANLNDLIDFRQTFVD